MRVAREPLAVLGVFFLATGILLAQYGQARAMGVAVGFGLIYAAAGAVLVAWSLKARPVP